MVDLKVDYELNHIYRLATNNPELIVAVTEWDNSEELELFQKSLALASDLKRLPVLRSLSGCVELDADMRAHMGNASVEIIDFILKLYNGDANEMDAEHQIWAGAGVIYFDTTAKTAQIHLPNIDWDYEGGLLLGDTITLGLIGECDGAVTTNIIPSAMLKAVIFLEIDWTPITSKQLDDYIKEHVYAREI